MIFWVVMKRKCCKQGFIADITMFPLKSNDVKPILGTISKCDYFVPKTCP